MTAARVRGALCPRRVRSVREDLVLAHRLELADLREDGARVADGVHHVARPRVALEADHRRALGDAAERLAQVLRGEGGEGGVSTGGGVKGSGAGGGAGGDRHLGAAHERDVERALVDVVGLVGGGEDLRLVDAVDLERLEHLALVEVADARLGHHGDRARLHHVDDHVRVWGKGGRRGRGEDGERGRGGGGGGGGRGRGGGKGGGGAEARTRRARDAAVGLDVGGDALEGHHGDGAGRLSDLRLLAVGDVHDHAALLEDGERALHLRGGEGAAG